MRITILCTVLALGCGMAVDPTKDGKGDAGGKLTADERERWEKVRARWKEADNEHLELLKGGTDKDAAPPDKKALESERQRLLKKRQTEKYHIVALVRGQWRTQNTSLQDEVRWEEGRPGGFHNGNSLDNAKQMAAEHAKDPGIDCAAIVDFYSEADPKAIHFTRDRKSDKDGVAAYLLQVQKSAGR